MAETITSLTALIIALSIVLGLYIFLPAKMARNRGRSAIGWVLLFWIVSPIWGIIFLLIIGDSKQKIRKDIIEELHRN
jgi:ABC-type phosphate transport system permease subunit